MFSSSTWNGKWLELSSSNFFSSSSSVSSWTQLIQLSQLKSALGPSSTSWPILFLDLSWRAARESLIGFISRPIAKSTNSVTLWCPLITRSLTSNGSKSSAIFQEYWAVYTLSPSPAPNWLN
ncbi:hypothetical protein PGT21_007266 [Puccinia graminis f. sp. tritici]|uniref:Uncharacterized protein n=1 Tax=Puccinia graminis f. sp. tritici TaxID=56615 RepID=A0A5B0PQZ2_PUCGR|nr:hypothetical protein PGT21_007266 [Puccinia graminis f. sp. tritici]